MIAKEIDIVAEFYEADPMGVVWHGNYIRWFERVRTALFDGLGFGCGPMMDSGYLWPIVDFQVRYVRPVRPGQRVRLRAELVEWENRIVVEYAVFDAGGGEKLTKGRSVQVALRGSDGELQFEVPAVLLDRIKGAL